MPNPNKSFQKNINKKDYSFLWFILLLIAFLGSLFQQWNGIQAGVIYASMFTGFSVILFLLFFFIKDDDRMTPISNYIRVPISTSTSLSAFMYMVGLIIPFLVNSIVGIFTSFSLTSLSIPLFSGGATSSVITLSVAKFEESMSWRIFNIFFVAGTIETFVYNFGLMIFFAFVGLGVLKLINGGNDLSFMKKSTFVILFALIGSVSFFIFSHTMNGTYTPMAFILAGLFLLISNISIYKAGIFLIFWAGYHQSNNLLYLISQFGLVPVLEGFLSIFGLVFLLFIVLLLFNIINNWSKIMKEFSSYWSR